ncbi:MAG TPA: hypothetical protein VK590_06705 [Saprospiraceae bacterium]|nr:hypothetical protein [Saprospiraceae bacterium]
MKKQSLLLLLFGALCMSFPLFARTFIYIPDNAADFLKGFGVAMIFGALIIQRKKKVQDNSRAEVV